MVMGDMEMRVDLAVIGAGPAGIAAALRAGALGLDVALIDEQEALGGHYLHHRTFPVYLASQAATRINQASELAELGIGYPPPQLDIGKFRDHIRNRVDNTADVLKQLCEKIGILLIRGRVTFDSFGRLRIEGGSINLLSFNNVVLATGRRQTLPPLQDGDATDSGP